ncbi:MAG: hypothetical protein HZC54_03745 [Verrucomicrobia bacterium]|nr:hypothetical protein [Verrucomicrobiota bacterium]
MRLRKDLLICDHKGRPTGQTHLAGEVWTVLPDSCSAKHDLWLRQADGRLHTWDDTVESVAEWFEVVADK